jgi:molybdopterin converting factor small subunit
MASVEVSLLLFASAREAAGLSQTALLVTSSSLDQSTPPTSDDLRQAISQRFPSLTPLLYGTPAGDGGDGGQEVSLTLAINQKYVSFGAGDQPIVLRGGEECAVIPPISGG